MVDFDVSYVGDDPDDIRKRLDDINLSARKRTNKALRKTAEEIKEDLENTSPVDTGEYSNSWYIFQVDYNEIWILDSADHAKFVMLPNSKMVGSPKADLPASGVLHNVKGVARSHKSGLRNNLAEELRDAFEGFRV